MSIKPAASSVTRLKFVPAETDPLTPPSSPPNSPPTTPKGLAAHPSSLSAPARGFHYPAQPVQQRVNAHIPSDLEQMQTAVNALLRRTAILEVQVARIPVLENSLREANANYTELQKKYTTLEKDLEATKAEKDTLAGRVKTLEGDNANLIRDNKALEAQVNRKSCSCIQKICDYASRACY